jgi:hypothetical protein
MKRILLRLTALALLLTAALWTDNTTQAASVSCDSLFGAQSACDDTFSGTVADYNDVVYNSPNHCDAQATAACAGSSNPNCYHSHFSTCYNTTVTNHNNRYTTYGNCLDAANTAWYSCHNEPDFCRGARNRASQCGGIYPETEDLAAYMDCYNASGINQCE